MKFEEAIVEIKSGKFMVRTAWTDGGYIALMPSMLYVWKIATLPNPSAGNWLPTFEDLVADDWKEFTKEVKVELVQEQDAA